MIRTRRKTRLSRQGALGLFILFAALVGMAGVASLPYLWLAMNHTQLAEKRAELHFLEAKLKTAKNVQNVGFTAADNIEPLFVSGATSGLATAGLQSLVGKIAQENGMIVERTQPLQTDRRDGLAVLRMEVETSGGIENLRGYLLAIEAGEPLIFVNQAMIYASTSRGEEGTALPSDKLTVALQLEAYGWWETEP